MGKGNLGYTMEEILNALKNHANPQSNPIVKEPEPVNDVENAKPVKPTNRCFFTDCKKKLMLSDPECRCKQRYCIGHRFPETHMCSYDFKAAAQKQLIANNPKVEGAKFERL